MYLYYVTYKSHEFIYMCFYLSFLLNFSCNFIEKYFMYSFLEFLKFYISKLIIASSHRDMDKVVNTLQIAYNDLAQNEF